MEKYNYLEAMKNDIHNYIKDNDILTEYNYNDRDELYEILFDELSISELVGNNGYYDTEEKCEEYICHNLDLAVAAIRDFDVLSANNKAYSELLEYPGQFIDALIRIYLLGQAIDEVLNELGIGDKE